MMTKRDVLQLRWQLRREEGRNARELELHTTDDLRRIYQTNFNDPIRLADGIVSRAQLVAEIRWRVFWARFGYGLLLVVTVIGTAAAVVAAVEGWK
jgi:hypothetical protein